MPTPISIPLFYHDRRLFVRLLKVAVILLFFFIATDAQAADRYWTGGASDRWESAANWAAGPTGGGGAGVPTANDVAIFRSSGTTIRIRSAVTIAGLRMTSTWSGSVLQGTGTLTIGTTGVRMGSGRLIGGNAAIVITGGYTQTGGLVTGIQNNFTLSGSLSITKGASSPFSTFTSTGTIILNGQVDQTFTVGANVTKTFNNLTLNKTGGGTIDDAIMNVNGGLNLTGDLTVTSGNLDLDTNTQTLDVDDDVVLANAAQATLSGATINIAGDLTVNPLATFTHTNGTLTLDGSSQTLSGSLTFYNLTKNTPSGTLTFAATTTQTVTNTLTLNGASLSPLKLRSSQTGTQWNINPRGTRVIEHLDVQDGNNTNSTAIDCTAACTNSGNNSNWTFTVSSTATSTGGSSGGGGGGGSGGRHSRAGTPPATPGADGETPSQESGETSGVPSVRGLLEVIIDGRSVIFADVPSNEWFASYIWEIITAGIATGYRDARGRLTGEFGPANPVTYAEIAKMALEAAGEDASSVSGFPENRSARRQWSENYIKLAEDLQLSVYASNLDVNRPATRGAVVQTIVESLGLPLSDGTGDYSDIRASHPHAGAIATATALGIISGDTDRRGNLTGTVRPDDPINRAEVAKILTNVLDLEP